MYIYLEFVDAKSSKFWEAHAMEETLTTRWGRIGTDGQEKVDDGYDDYAAAAQSALTQATKKQDKGYVATQPPWFQAMLADDDLASELTDDIMLRILTGDTTTFEDACFNATEALEGAELDGAAADFYDDDPERAAHALASLLWQMAADKASEYADQPSDSEALLRALSSLEDDGLKFLLFSDWPSVEIDEGDLGGALVGYSDWEHLEPNAESTLTLGLLRPEGSVTDLAATVQAALTAEGLRPGPFTPYDAEEDDPNAGYITMPVHWRWRVQPLQDVEE